MEKYVYNQSGQPSAEYFRMIEREERVWYMERQGLAVPECNIEQDRVYDIHAEASKIVARQQFVGNMNA